MQNACERCERRKILAKDKKLLRKTILVAKDEMLV